MVLGTLVLQGLTLRPLMLRLRLEDDGSVDREVHLARVATLREALAAAEAHEGGESAALVRHSYTLQLRRAEAGLVTAGRDDATVLRAATEAQRHRLVALRSDGTIGDAAFQRVEEEMDWAELGWAQVVGHEERTDGAP